MMKNEQVAKFNMYEMHYQGIEVESNLSLVSFGEEYYERYKILINEGYYEMRKALNIRSL